MGPPDATGPERKGFEYRRTRITIVLLCALWSAQWTFQHGLYSLSTTGGRPLSQMVRLLEDRYSWTITYEDPALLSPGDIVDVTATIPRHREDTRTLGPRGGTFHFTPKVPDVMGVTEESILEALLSDYRASGLAGAFTLRRHGSLFHVIPVATRDGSGQQVPFRSILETKITIPAADRDALQMVGAIVDAIKVGSSARFGVGVLPINMFRRARFNGGAENEVARDVLSRVLLATRTDLSWTVLCSPSPDSENHCMLNIHVITPGGSGGN